MKKIFPIVLGLVVFAYSSVASGLQFEKQGLYAEGYGIVLDVPKGMKVEFVTPLDQPRFLTMGPDKELIIGSKGGNLYRLVFPYTEVELLVSLAGYFHSTVYSEGKLYAAETGGLWVADYLGVQSSISPQDFKEIVKLPSATGGHSSRTIAKGPDGRLYVGLGISGNCSDEYLHSSYPFERRRGGVFVLDSSMTLQPFSSGLRNPIGLAFHPRTGVLYATNAGPDNLGYDNPPEVLAALAQNSFHGMPWFQYYSGSFQSGACAVSASPRPVVEATSPAAFFPPRSTPQGITFLGESSLGSQMTGNAAVAIHGSWATRPGMGIESRREPKLALVIFNNNRPGGVENLVTGFQRSDGSRFARPCGIIVGGDGHLYFTSDTGDVTGLFRLVPRQKSLAALMGVLLRGS